MTQEVLVYTECPGGKPGGMALELLGAGGALVREGGGTLSAVLLGHRVAGAAQDLGAHGAARVYVADHGELEVYRGDPHLHLLEQLCRERQPAMVLFGHDSAGRDLAPRLAARLGTGLAPDCVELSLDPGTRRLLAARPIYGGNLRAILAIDTDPQIATVRPKTMEPASRREGEGTEVVPLTLDPTPLTQRVKVAEVVKEKAAGIRLEDAEIIVTGGRGVNDQSGVKLVEELAHALGAAVGATRGSVDAGLFPGELQVGLTGKMVAPQLYFAVALSGSMQHLAGCGGSKNIIAINTDPDAPIFQRAKYGVVGDFRQVVPPLAQKLREMLER